MRRTKNSNYLPKVIGALAGQLFFAGVVPSVSFATPQSITVPASYIASIKSFNVSDPFYGLLSSRRIDVAPYSCWYFYINFSDQSAEEKWSLVQIARRTGRPLNFTVDSTARGTGFCHATEVSF